MCIGKALETFGSETGSVGDLRLWRLLSFSQKIWSKDLFCSQWQTLAKLFVFSPTLRLPGMLPVSLPAPGLQL